MRSRRLPELAARADIGPRALDRAHRQPRGSDLRRRLAALLWSARALVWARFLSRGTPVLASEIWALARSGPAGLRAARQELRRRLDAREPPRARSRSDERVAAFNRSLKARAAAWGERGLEAHPRQRVDLTLRDSGNLWCERRPTMDEQERDLVPERLQAYLSLRDDRGA